MTESPFPSGAVDQATKLRRDAELAHQARVEAENAALTQAQLAEQAETARAVAEERAREHAVRAEQAVADRAAAAEQAQARADAERTAAGHAIQLAEARGRMVAAARTGRTASASAPAATDQVADEEPHPAPPVTGSPSQPAAVAPAFAVAPTVPPPPPAVTPGSDADGARAKRSWFRASRTTSETGVLAPRPVAGDDLTDDSDAHDEPGTSVDDHELETVPEEPEEAREAEQAGHRDDQTIEPVPATTDAGIVRYHASHSRRGLVTVAGVVAAAGAVIVVVMAITGNLVTPSGIGVAIVTLVALMLVLRVGALSTSVTLEDGQLDVKYGDIRHRFDLTSEATLIEVEGVPGDSGWQMTVVRRGLTPVEITARTVDPEPFTEAIRQWRPNL